LLTGQVMGELRRTATTRSRRTHPGHQGSAADRHRVIAVVSLGFCVNAFMYVAARGARATGPGHCDHSACALLGLQLLVISRADGRRTSLASGQSVSSIGLLCFSPFRSSACPGSDCSAFSPEESCWLFVVDQMVGVGTLRGDYRGGRNSDLSV